MARRYAAFMLRCWLSEAGEQRIEIEHVQSGEKTRCSSAMAAVAWLYSRTAGRPIPPGGGDHGDDSTGYWLERKGLE